MASNVKTVKEIAVEKYGSIGSFLDSKLKVKSDVKPSSRAYYYKLINHQIKNPGIKSLMALAKMLGIKKEYVFEEYSR